MQMAAAADGQTWSQVGDLALAFGLSSLIGLERQFHGKSAGLRTQAIVGTASALILLVSKYGFADVLSQGLVNLDPSRVAAQIVSGVGFLGAGLIITRRGAIHGLTTAAAVWETAAIGMAAGAGLALLAIAVTVLHFVIVFVYTPLSRFIGAHGHHERNYVITYEDGRGVLRDLISTCADNAWVIRSLRVLDRDHEGSGEPVVTVAIGVDGRHAANAPHALAGVDGVLRIDRGDQDEE